MLNERTEAAFNIEHSTLNIQTFASLVERDAASLTMTAHA
jgi:hypothetical protein